MNQTTEPPTACHSRREPWFNALGYILLSLALPSVLENAYEVYVGTLLAGPQMLGFVLAHADPGSAFVRVIRYSAAALVLFQVYGLVAVSRGIAAGSANRHQKFFCWCFVLLSAHGLFVSLYPYWAPWFAKAGQAG